MEILREHKEALTLALEKAHLWEEMISSLFHHKILSSEDYSNILSLDANPKTLDPALKARYLLHVAFLTIEKNQNLTSAFIEVLIINDETRALGYYLLKDIKKCEDGEESVVTPSDNDIIVSEVHVNILVKILHDVRHKWENIGIALNLSEADREECRDFKSNSRSLYQILLKWYKMNIGNNSVCLETLKKALQGPLVGEYSVSETLFEKFREKVLVIVPPQKRPKTGNSFTENTNEVQVTDGKSSILEVAVSESNEAGEYQWFKDGDPLHHNSKYFKIHTKFLLIKHACQGMDGIYSCNIGNTQILRKTLVINFSLEKRSLLKNYSRIPEITKDSWPPVGSSSFIKLALVNEKRPIHNHHDDSVRGDMDDILREKKIEPYESLFQKYEEGALILIEGRPGSGKTTLTRKLSKDWATKPDILTGANLVFLISLRVLNITKEENITLSSILEHYYSSANQQNKLINVIEKENGKDYCFIVDGLDEYKDRNTKGNLIHRLVNKEYLQNAMVIVASRPIGSASLRRREITSKRIEVLGFSKESIFDYIDSYFLHNEQNGEKCEDLKQYLTVHINLLHMCYLPVHAAMICFIYQQPIKDIPVTETKMYECFILLTIKRKLESDGLSKEYNTLSDLDGNILESFQKVCKLAFDMTIESKQTITLNPTLSKNDSDIHSLGLVTIDKTARLLSLRDLYSFLHLTFQEFLAAFYIKMCPVEEQLEIVTNYVDYIEMQNVWKFYCGSNTFDFNDTSLNKIMTSQHSNNIYRIQCAFESQQNKVCDSIFTNGETVSLRFDDHTFLPIDMNALAYTCSQTTTPVNGLVFDGCILNEAEAQIFLNKVSKERKDCITFLSFSINTSNKELFKAIRLLLTQCQCLNELCLEDTEIGLLEVSILTDTVELSSLKYLNIHMPLKSEPFSNQYSDQDILTKISKAFPNLEEVRYTYNENSNETCKQCLIALLKSFKCKIRPICEIPISILSNINIGNLERVPDFLKVYNLVLVNCNLLDSNLESLINLVTANLEILRLDCNLITLREVTVMHQFLEKCTKLTHISLSCNMIDDQGAMNIAQSILPSKLLELNLQGNCFGDQGVLALAEAADKMCDEFRLILGNRHISNEFCEKIKEIETVEFEQTLFRLSKFLNSSHLGSVMPCFENVLTLNLSSRRISEAAFTEFTEGLISHCYCLQTLDLSYCNLKNVYYLIRGGHALPNLCSLNLTGNQLVEGSFTFTDELKGFENLKELNLSQNQLKKGGVESVAYCFRHQNRSIKSE